MTRWLCRGTVLLALLAPALVIAAEVGRSPRRPEYEPCFRDRYVSCWGCSGQGERTCSWCNGSGKRYQGFGKYKPCSDCDGRGRKKCSSCGGTGVRKR